MRRYVFVIQFTEFLIAFLSCSRRLGKVLAVAQPDEARGQAMSRGYRAKAAGVALLSANVVHQFAAWRIMVNQPPPPRLFGAGRSRSVPLLRALSSLITKDFNRLTSARCACR